MPNEGFNAEELRLLREWAAGVFHETMHPEEFEYWQGSLARLAMLGSEAWTDATPRGWLGGADDSRAPERAKGVGIAGEWGDASGS